MGARVLLGKRGSDYGLFVSQKDIDVTNTSLTTPLAFDSRAVRGLMISAKGEGSLAPAASNSGGVDYPTSVTISHGLGYVPAYAVRWCIAADLSSGVATKMRSPAYSRREELELTGEDEEQEEQVTTDEYGCTTGINTSNLIIYNHYFGESSEGDGPEYWGTGKQTIYYAYIIFKAKSFGTEL
jgi:hypothetical protein